MLQAPQDLACAQIPYFLIFHSLFYTKLQFCIKMDIDNPTWVLRNKKRGEGLFPSSPFLFLTVFFSGRLSAAQMSLVFIFFKNLSHSLSQLRIYQRQFTCYVFMYRAFADPEKSCGITNRSAVCDDIFAQDLASLFAAEIYHSSLFPVELFQKICYT